MSDEVSEWRLRFRREHWPAGQYSTTTIYATRRTAVEQCAALVRRYGEGGEGKVTELHVEARPATPWRTVTIWQLDGAILAPITPTATTTGRR